MRASLLVGVLALLAASPVLGAFQAGVNVRSFTAGSTTVDPTCTLNNVQDPAFTFSDTNCVLINTGIYVKITCTNPAVNNGAWTGATYTDSACTTATGTANPTSGADSSTCVPITAAGTHYAMQVECRNVACTDAPSCNGGTCNVAPAGSGICTCTGGATGGYCQLPALCKTGCLSADHQECDATFSNDCDCMDGYVFGTGANNDVCQQVATTMEVTSYSDSSCTTVDEATFDIPLATSQCMETSEPARRGKFSCPNGVGDTWEVDFYATADTTCTGTTVNTVQPVSAALPNACTAVGGSSPAEWIKVKCKVATTGGAASNMQVSAVILAALAIISAIMQKL